MPHVRAGAEPETAPACGWWGWPIASCWRCWPRPCAAGAAITRRGISDLALADRKVSGNSLRMKQGHPALSRHAAVRLSLGVDRPGAGDAPRSPTIYVACGGQHDAFVANLSLPAEAIRRAVASTWKAAEPYADWPQARTAALAAEKYIRPEWNGQALVAAGAAGLAIAPAGNILRRVPRFRSGASPLPPGRIDRRMTG